jgi:hypothetical protein
VANAATIYQTKTVERAALANTNSRINLLNTNLTGTNTAIRALDAAKLSVANAVAIYVTKVNPTTSGLLAHTGRATISTNLAVTGNTTVGGSLTVTGDLTINGTTTTLNSTTLSVDDINITLGDTASPSNATADGGGITLKGTTDKTFNWVSATAAWTSSENVNLANGKSLYLNGTDFRATYAANSYVKSVLANTNSFIKSQLANTNLRVNLINTNLTGTNTALRTLISDRLQVANAVATYQTKTVERAALANTNASIATQASRITLVNTNLLGTNTAIRALDAQKLSVANATTLLAAKATWTALTGTNTSVRTLISDRYQVANVNTLLAAKATWTALTGTNTAIRLLVSDRLQVANAVATYQTKAVERAALANTNLRINLINTNLTGTNTALRTLVSDRYQVANVNTLLNAKATWTALTGTNTALRTLISDRLQVANASATYLTKNNPVITGSLTANGSTGTSGYYLRTSGTGVYWSPASSGVSGANGFSGILVGANVISADSTTDRLTLVAGSGITIAANPTTDTITFTASGGSAPISLTKVSVKDLIQTDQVVTNVSAVYANTVVDNSLLNLRATWSALTGTNTAIRALDAQKLSVANATTLFATKASWAGLTGTNTALRTLISDRLQVANAASIYQTKVIERAALANTNAYIGAQATRITLVNTNLTATNTAIRALDTAKLSVANAVSTYATKSNPTTSGLLAHTGRATISTNLAVTGNTAVTGTLTDSIGNVRDIVNNGQSSAYVLVASDNGKMINITTGGVTVNISIFSAGNNITIYNNSASSQTITQGTSVTMYLAGTATTGNRTLAQRGICTIVCVSAGVFVISGAGLT